MRIVFATDLSDANEAAIRSRTCLDCLDNIGVTEVHLVTVVPDNVTSGLPGMGAASDARQALQAQRDVFESAGFDVETHVARGTPYRRINGFAERLNADMVVIGSRGESPLENRLVGSTTRNVARTSARPLLVERIAPPESDKAVVKEPLFEHVLFTTDFSENAQKAFEYLPHLTGATQEVDLLHVQHGDTEISDAQEKLDELAAEVEREMGIEAGTNIRNGDPVQEILAEEERVGATTTLLGTRGQSRLRRLLLGSVSEAVVARGNNNVLLVPPAASQRR